MWTRSGVSAWQWCGAGLVCVASAILFVLQWRAYPALAYDVRGIPTTWLGVVGLVLFVIGSVLLGFDRSILTPRKRKSELPASPRQSTAGKNGTERESDL